MKTDNANRLADPENLYMPGFKAFKRNEMNQALDHFSAFTGLNGPGEPPEDDTAPSRHGIRNLNPRVLRPSKLPLGHGGSPQY